MGIFSGLKRGGDKKKKAAKYHEQQPGIAEKDILNQAFLGDDPYLRVGGPAKLFPGNESIRPHDYRPGTPGSDIDSVYGAPAHGSGYGSNYGSRQQSPAVLQPPQFSQFSNNSSLNLPSRPWSSGTNNGPQDDRPSTSHGPGTKQWGSNATTFESRFGPVHRRTDTQGTATPASRPGSRSGSVAGVPQSPQSPRSPAHSSRHTKSQTSNMDKNLSTSSASPTENSETSQHTSATTTTTSEGLRATSPPSTVSDHSRPTSSADKAWPVANVGSPERKSGTSSPTPKPPTSPKDTRARDAAKKKDLAIKVPRRRSWSAQINQLEKAWLEEQLSTKNQNAQNDAVPLGSQLEVTEEKEKGEEKEVVVPAVSEAKQATPAPAPPANLSSQPQSVAIQQQQRMSPQDFPQQRQEMPRQSPRAPQGGPMPGPRVHMAGQSAQQFPIRRGPPPLSNGRSFDHSFDPSFDPQFDPRNMSRNNPRGDTRFDPRAAPRQGPPRQMPQGPPSGQRERGRAVDYDFMPSSIDQYGGVGGGPYAMGRTSRVAPPGVQMPDMPPAASRSASGGAQRHRQMLSDVDFSTTIDMGGRMPETRLPAVLRGSQSMQQLPRLTRDARSPMPMSPPHTQNQNQGQYHSRAGSMASQASQGPHYYRGHAHPQQQHGMRSASSQGMRSPPYPLPLPTVSMRDGGDRYPGGPSPAGPSMAHNMGPGPGPRRLPHSSSADLTVYRDQHHQYGPARSPMGSPGYGPGPRSGPNSGPGLGLDQGHPHQQFGPPMDRRNVEPRSDNRADPRYLTMASPASPGAFDRQLSDVAEDIEEKSVLDMPGIAVKDFANKKDSAEPSESAAQYGEASRAADLNAQSIPSDLPPPYAPGPNAAAVVVPVGPTEILPVVAESEAEVQELSAPAEVSEDRSVKPIESSEAVEEAVPKPAEPEVDVAEPTPAATQTTPKLSFVEPTRSISPAYSNASSTEKSASTRPLSPAFTNFPLTPVTPSVEKMPSHTVSNSISFSRSIEEPTRSTDERSPERSQAIAERRRTRYPTLDNNTPPDTPIVDAMPPSPAYVAPVVEATENAEDLEDSREHEHNDGAADVFTDAATLTNVDVSRPETPVVLAKEEPAEIEAEEAEAGVVAQPIEELEELKQVDTEATEPELSEAEAVIETGRAEIVEATAAPITVESTGADIVETVVAVYPRSGSGATNYSSPPMSPISLPAGDAEPSVNANWPLPSVFVSPASRSTSPSSPTSPALSLAEAIASPAPSVQAVPTIVAPEDADTKSIDDTLSEDEKDTDSVDDDRLMGALPSPTRKTAFTASIYAKDIGIGPYAFDDATLSSLSAIDKPSEPLATEHEVNTDSAFGIVRPSTPTRDNAPSQFVIASPESTYSWGGDEVIAVSARQSDEVVEANEKAENVKTPEFAQTTELAEPAEMVKSVPEEKKETGLMDVPPESIGLARGPSILADMDTLSSRGKRRWNIAHHADQETLQESPMEVVSPAVRTEGFAATVPTSPVSPSRMSPLLPNSLASPTAASPTRMVKKGPPRPLTSVPQFNRHVPTDVVDKFGTTFI